MSTKWTRIKSILSKRSAFDKKIKSIIGFYPGDASLYTLALTHRSSLGHVAYPAQYNERLEFLGDSVLGMVTSEYLYENFPDLDEGVLTKAKSAIVSRKKLNQIAKKMGLRNVILSNLDLENFPISVEGNALEALFGAVYFDAGLIGARKFFQHIVDSGVDVVKIVTNDENYKSRLIEWAQKNRVEVDFELLHEEGDEYQRTFTCAVVVDGKKLGEGKGSSKKAAEQQACKSALTNLKEQ